jgi:hypothetical protein
VIIWDQSRAITISRHATYSIIRYGQMYPYCTMLHCGSVRVQHAVPLYVISNCHFTHYLCRCTDHARFYRRNGQYCHMSELASIRSTYVHHTNISSRLRRGHTHRFRKILRSSLCHHCTKRFKIVSFTISPILMQQIDLSRIVQGQ